MTRSDCADMTAGQSTAAVTDARGQPTAPTWIETLQEPEDDQIEVEEVESIVLN